MSQISKLLGELNISPTVRLCDKSQAMGDEYDILPDYVPTYIVLQVSIYHGYYTYYADPK